MLNYSWLTLGEAACYLRTSESVLRVKLEKGEVPYSTFDGQPLLHKSQLDEYLFGLQASQVGKVPPSPIGTQITIGHAAGTRVEETRQEEKATPEMNNFMAAACRLWDDGHRYLVKAGVTGASCQFDGKPRLWVFPNKFQIPAKGKGNDLYGKLRRVLVVHFSAITSKATVHITSPDFSWRKFEEFVRQVKDVCNRHPQVAEEPSEPSIYHKCIEWWEEQPAFTTEPGTRGCSARHEHNPRLWFFPDYIQIPSEGQGNSLFDNIQEIKERLFPNAHSRTRIIFGDPGVDLDRLHTFVEEVKNFCKANGSQPDGNW